MFIPNKTKKIIFLAAISLVLLLGFGWRVTLAQDLYGINAANNIGLLAPSTTDVRLVIVNVIRFILGFLGLVATIVILYGGWLWMTSNGDVQRVQAAKRTLIAAVIGLIIIIAAFAIVSIIVGFIQGAINSGTGTDSCNNSCNYSTEHCCAGTCEPLGSACSGNLPSGGNSFVLRSTIPHDTATKQPRNVIVRGFVNAQINNSVDALLTNNFNLKKLGDIASTTGFFTANPQSPVTCSSTIDAVRTTMLFQASTNLDSWSRYQATINGNSGIIDINNRPLQCGILGTAPCVFTFDTNDLIDNSGPTAGLIPGEFCHFNSGSTTPANANILGGWGRDDTGIAQIRFFVAPPLTQIYSIPGNGNYYQYEERQVDTSSMNVGDNITLTIQADDLAGNTISSSTSVIIRTGHCCDGIKNADEENVDCGGADCDSCASMNPLITNITPDNGAPGNLVTITGRYFGTTPGQVYFTDASGQMTVLAPAPSTVNPACVDNWQNNQIIVVVPVGAQTGPIRVVTASGKEDTTAPASPPQIDFTVNATNRPGLCLVNPDSAYFNDSFTLQGNNFAGTNQSVRFGNNTDYLSANNIQNWTNQSVSAQVPNVSRGLTSVYVTSSSTNSNPLYFTVLYNASKNPIIDYINPTQGPNGQYITIYGSNFMSYNSSVSRVIFINNATLASTTAGIDFPTQCQNSWWHDKYIVVKVPSNSSATVGDYHVVVTNSAANTSNAVGFNIISGNPGPGICTLDPNNGPIDFAVKIYGDNLGNTQGTGKVNFYQNIPATSYSNWSKQEIDTNVPTGAVTGQVSVSQNSTSSNSLPFTVGNCTQASDCESGYQCCSSGQWKGICRTSCAGTAYATTTFGWTFFTASSTSALPGQPCYYGGVPGACDLSQSTCDTTTTYCQQSTCTCQPISTSTDSCEGVAKATGHCLTGNQCPNSPGQCSPHTSTGNSSVPTGKTCDDTCASITGCDSSCVYNSNQDGNFDTCIKTNTLCAATTTSIFGDSLNETCVVYNHANNWEVTSAASCPTSGAGANWVRIDSNHCVDTLSHCDICPANFSCRSYNGDSRCVYNQRLCSGDATCVGNQCMANDQGTCECCCDETLNNPTNGTNPDCCAPLTCANSCGQGVNFGYCSGCANVGGNQSAHDAACNCNGTSGKICDTTVGDGICVDCSAITNSTECGSHDACCVDQKNGGSCRGVGAGSKGSDGESCAYFTCDTTGASPTCGEDDLQGTYSTLTSCSNACGAGGAGQRCVGTGNSYCTSGVPFCASYFNCLDDPTNATAVGYCRCCCDPTANTCPNNLTCVADKMPCSGGNRGLCCGCKTNADCGGVPDGCGKDTCCHATPNVIDNYPVNQVSGVCRNTLISATFDSQMDVSSFTGNLILLGDYGTGACPAGTQYLALAPLQPRSLTWLDKIKNAWQGLLAVIWPSNSALAQWSPVAGNTYCAVKGQTTGYTNANNQTILNFSSDQALDATTTYFVIVQGDTNLDNSHGVLSINGVGMAGPDSDIFNGVAYKNSYVWAFQTGGNICTLDSVVIKPGSFLFSVPNSDYAFVANPLAANGQIINSLPGVYAWVWKWQSADKSVVTVTNNGLPDPIQIVTSQNVKDAQTIVSATASTTINNLTGVSGSSATGQSHVYVFLCANPWPPRDVNGDWAPWSDASNNCTSGMAGTGCSGSYNYELYYCRDAGKAGTYDDLPAILSDQAITRGMSSSSLKETYFFRETVPTATTSNFSITNDGTGNSLTVNWAGVAGVSTYRLYWGKKSGNYSNHQDLTGTNYQVTGLTRNVVYYFLLDGISGNRVERALSNVATSSPQKTVAPAAPTNLQAATTTTGVQLSWGAVADAASYKVHYGTSAGVYGQSQNVGNVTEVLVTGLAGNNQYYFTVTAIDVAGNEGVSAVPVSLTLTD